VIAAPPVAPERCAEADLWPATLKPLDSLSSTRRTVGGAGLSA